jgi:long-chain acyl-CoA synthetase
VLEARLTGDPFFDQALVIGEARPYLSALLVAEPKALATLRAQLGLDADYSDAEARRDLEAAVLEKARNLLRGYATATPLQRIALVPAFTLKNGLLTSTGKPKRAHIFKAHAAELARLYQGHCNSLSTDCSSNAETGR